MRAGWRAPCYQACYPHPRPASSPTARPRGGAPAHRAQYLIPTHTVFRRNVRRYDTPALTRQEWLATVGGVSYRMVSGSNDGGVHSREFQVRDGAVCGFCFAPIASSGWVVSGIPYCDSDHARRDSPRGNRPVRVSPDQLAFEPGQVSG